jgi:hypothetical protein
LDIKEKLRLIREGSIIEHSPISNIDITPMTLNEAVNEMIIIESNSAQYGVSTIGGFFDTLIPRIMGFFKWVINKIKERFKGKTVEIFKNKELLLGAPKDPGLTIIIPDHLVRPNINFSALTHIDFHHNLMDEINNALDKDNSISQNLSEYIKSINKSNMTKSLKNIFDYTLKYDHVEIEEIYDHVYGKLKEVQVSSIDKGQLIALLEVLDTVDRSTYEVSKNLESLLNRVRHELEKETDDDTIRTSLVIVNGFCQSALKTFDIITKVFIYGYDRVSGACEFIIRHNK